ncbi:MAG: energy transducer TonB [Pyrinomonadaceae bacterium]|nr:energy transducer TonB [Pyrinomonadaceae bacterium]
MRSSISLAAIAALLLFISTTSYSQSVYGDRNLTPPQVKKQPKVEPPKIAKESGLGGNVTVWVTVGPNGSVTAVDSIIGPGWVCPSIMRADVVALRDAARDAALKTKFAPARRGSVAETATTSITFSFPEDPKTKIFTAPVAIAASEPKDGERAPNTYTVKGDANYTAAPPPPDAPGAPNKYTVKGDANYSAASAPPGAPGDSRRQLSSGVLNGKARSLPKPPYPAAARAVRAGGAVTIQVLIDEEGKMFSAEPVTGHPLLRSAARTAACSAQFTPTMLSGNPVKVLGVIVYNFVAP